MKDLPIILPVKDRIELTKQTVDTLLKAEYPFKLIIISDGSEEPTVNYLKTLTERAKVIFMNKNKGSSAAKNAGMSIAGDADYYYITDNDIYFTQGWLKTLVSVMDADPKIGILGGRNHSYHGTLSTIKAGNQQVNICYQQVGYSMLIRKQTWYEAGPYIQYDTQELGREDVTFCNKARETGWLVGHLSTPILFHCGMKNTFNADTAGHESERLQNFPEGAIIK